MQNMRILVERGSCMASGCCCKRATHLKLNRLLESMVATDDTKPVKNTLSNNNADQGYRVGAVSCSCRNPS